MVVIRNQENIIAQIIDANLDRAREGLRVLEDWCRFGLSREDLVVEIKDCRQKLGQKHLKRYKISRFTSQDPTPQLTHPAQNLKQSPYDLICANSSRVQESLRVIEEYALILDKNLSDLASEIRYKIYKLEIDIISADEKFKRKKILEEANVYVITSPKDNLIEIIQKSLSAGIKIIQLRIKDNILQKDIDQAKEISKLCKENNALFIINDRVDIALLVDADGVHLGQQDMKVKDARNILGKSKIIGLSTENINQMKNYKNEWIDDFGLGPIYQSRTKNKQPIGISAIKNINNISTPIFVIGGIDFNNINELKNAGVKKVAIVSTIMDSSDPLEDSKKLIELMNHEYSN